MPVRQKRVSKRAQGKLPPAGSARRWAAIPSAYRKLMAIFWLRPLQTDEELTEAMALADHLASRDQPLLPEEEMYFEVLCDLIEKYEDKHIVIPDAGAAEILRFLIEQRGVTPQKVAVETGIVHSIISAALKGDRELSRKHIEKLAAHFGVEPAVFLPA